MIVREIKDKIEYLASKYPIVALTGPRQSGKTTILKTVFNEYKYVSLENPNIREFLAIDPEGFFDEYSGRVIFDEAQRSPDLFSYLQTIVDENKIMGQFIISGSQNFHLMENITQSLAGRVAIFRLFPLDNQELRGAGLLSDDFVVQMQKGFYPAIYDRDIPSKIFYANYLQTYVQRDVSELINLRDLKLFQKFISLCATRAGQLVNYNELAKECGISQPTAKGWLSALETSYIVFQLQPYHKNFSKRIIKTPKLYFYDTGLLCYLLKIHNPSDLILNPLKGSIFENMMIAQYIKRMHHTNNLKEIWFWRDSNNREIDLLVENSFNDIGIYEIKASQTIQSKFLDNINYFEETTSKEGVKINKNLVYGGGKKVKRFKTNVLNWASFDV